MTKPQTRVRVITSAILILGLGSAIAIYIFADAPPANPLGELGDSKMYVHDMLLYGGKANLLGSEFAEWLGTLWHGRRLAFTVACITLLLAGVFRYFGAPQPPDPDAAVEPRQDQNEA
ncbi:MAG TPA: hypothetical protein VKD04_00795 [Burkholderiales bacterium]|nr:hypothetical protein [Burkholderiales bacterium]